MDKQIETIAKAICDCCPSRPREGTCQAFSGDCAVWEQAELLYHAGYRKEKTCIFEEWQDTWAETSVWCCSNCKEDFYFLEGDAKENMYQYCPNCGARITEYKECLDEYED